MEEVYDLHKHSHCIIIYIDKTYVYINIIDTSNRNSPESKVYIREEAFITYNKEKTKILQGDLSEIEDNEAGIRFDGFMDGLHQAFKKSKDTWDENDKFLMKAISDFIRVTIENLMEHEDMKNESLDSFHYAFVVPSEWEEEIREDLIRPIFIQANLILKNDHKDRLLFFSDIETICYHLSELDSLKNSFKRGQNTIMYRRISIDHETVLIKLDLIKTSNPLFDFPNSMLFHKIMRSNSLHISSENIKNCIKTFLKEKLFLDNQYTDQEKTIEIIAEKIYRRANINMDSNNDEDNDNNKDNEYSEDSENNEYFENTLMKPIFTDISDWKLNNSQTSFLKSLRFFDICTTAGKNLLVNIKDALSNDFVKMYKLLVFEDQYSSEIKIDHSLFKWLKYILEYNRRTLSEITTLSTIELQNNDINHDIIVSGVKLVVSNTIENSNMYCSPRIISTENLNFKPNAIVNIDISFKSTLLSYSLSNDDGVVEEEFDHSYFTTDKCLPSLECFYDISNAITLRVKEKFILFAEDYLIGDFTSSSVNREFLLKIEAILNKSCSNKVLISTQQRKYIRTFLLMYLIYIKEIISSKLSSHKNSKNIDLSIGYVVSMEKMVLDNIIGAKEDLRKLVYACGLISKDKDSNKLRIISQGEGVLPLIQQSLDLEIPVKSYFVFAQLYEDYIQLTLNQVVTSYNLEEKQQEAIIIEDKIIPIQNIYQSLCLNMWENLIYNSSSILLCDFHSKSSKKNVMIELFSLKTRTEFMNNLTQYISNNVLAANSKLQNFDATAIQMNHSCNCKVYLTVHDVIEISFKPLLKDISSIMLTSLINKNMFGKYKNIECHFCLIHFNHNHQFQDVLISILKEESDNSNPKRGIETLCVVLPDLPNQLFQPALKLQSFLYKGFQTGSLHQIYTENYAFLIYHYDNDHGSKFTYKNSITDTEAIVVNSETAFPLLKKGDMISRTEEKRIFYLNVPASYVGVICIELYKYRSSGILKKDEKVLEKKDSWKKIHKFILSRRSLGYIDSTKPFMINIKSLGYSSSIQISVKAVGKEFIVHNIIEIGEPMTLSRF